MRYIELLAPARDADVAIEAIKHGADAVYMGASSHGARASAGNSLEDVARVVDFAHRFGARVYITVNTIVYPSELAQVEQLIHRLYLIGVDALIVQDLGLLRLNLPPIALHASTQCDIRTPDKARFLELAGFSQLVVARELSVEEMAAICSAVSVPVEAFVHGALCVSYSGDCQAGFATMGRSANRGECPQICRHKFDLVDASGRKLIEDKHLLSLRDLNRLSLLPQMLEAGVSSLKIEGRLKDVAYVKNITAAYRRRLDEIIAANPDRFCRSSFGSSSISFEPDVEASFNRGFTSYFSIGPRPEGKMASFDTPKWIGRPVGKVVDCRDKRITARLDRQLSNADGIGWFDAMRRFNGVRINRVEGSTLFAAQSVSIPRGTTLYLNHDHRRQAALEQDTACRYIEVDLTLRLLDNGLALDIADSFGHSASASVDVEEPFQKARSSQLDGRRDTLAKLGDTVYRLRSLSDLAADAFIPRSLLADLRRKAVQAIDRAIRLNHHFDYRRPEQKDIVLPMGSRLTYHDNVANPAARQFYLDHGAVDIRPALEVDPQPEGDLTVMTTRYCLRREAGRCLRTPQGKQWPGQLYLISGPMKLALRFDCQNCRMHVVKEADPQKLANPKKKL